MKRDRQKNFCSSSVTFAEQSHLKYIRYHHILDFSYISFSDRPILYRSLEVTYSSKVRVMTYVLPTFAGSVILNIPKFLEAKHVHTWERDEVNNLRNVLTYNVTSLR